MFGWIGVMEVISARRDVRMDRSDGGFVHGSLKL
jgi:hypothetical protein